MQCGKGHHRGPQRKTLKRQRFSQAQKRRWQRIRLQREADAAGVDLATWTVLSEREAARREEESAASSEAKRADVEETTLEASSGHRKGHHRGPHARTLATQRHRAAALRRWQMVRLQREAEKARLASFTTASSTESEAAQTGADDVQQAVLLSGTGDGEVNRAAVSSSESAATSNGVAVGWLVSPFQLDLVTVSYVHRDGSTYISPLRAEAERSLVSEADKQALRELSSVLTRSQTRATCESK